MGAGRIFLLLRYNLAISRRTAAVKVHFEIFSTINFINLITVMLLNHSSAIIQIYKAIRRNVPYYKHIYINSVEQFKPVREWL